MEKIHFHLLFIHLIPSNCVPAFQSRAEFQQKIRLPKCFWSYLSGLFPTFPTELDFLGLCTRTYPCEQQMSASATGWSLNLLLNSTHNMHMLNVWAIKWDFEIAVLLHTLVISSSFYELVILWVHPMKGRCSSDLNARHGRNVSHHFTLSHQMLLTFFKLNKLRVCCRWRPNTSTLSLIFKRRSAVPERQGTSIYTISLMF